MTISARITVTSSLHGSTHERLVNGTLYRFTRYNDGALSIVAAAAFDEPSSTWLPAHLFFSCAQPNVAAAPKALDAMTAGRSSAR